MNVILHIAVRNVVRNSRRSAAALGSLAFGIACVIVFFGFIMGFTDMLVGNLVKARTGAFTVAKIDGYMNDDTALRDRLLAIPHVTALSPRVQFRGLLSNGRTQVLVMGRAIDPVLESKVCPERSRVVVQQSGSLSGDDFGAAILGVELAGALDLTDAHGALATGSVITISATGPEGRNNSLDLTLKGVSRSLFAHENKNAIDVPLAFAQSLLGIDAMVSEYALSVDELDALDDVITKVRQMVGPDYVINDWKTIQPYGWDLIRQMRVMFSWIGAFLFVVTFFGIMNSIMGAVLERVQEIGSMMAFGTKRHQILRLILTESAVLGAAGGLFGAIGGGLLTLWFSHHGITFGAGSFLANITLTARSSLTVCVGAGLMAIPVAVVSGLLPAWKAARMKPSDALRG